MLGVELLSHYRRDVFRALDDDNRVSMTFATGGGVRDASIPSMPSEELGHVVRVRNRYFGTVVWQSGMLSALLRIRPDVAIFTGDSRHLSTWMAAITGRALGMRVLFWTIGWHRPETGVRRLVRVAFYRLANKLLIYGRVGRRYGIGAGYPEDRMRVILNSSAVGVEPKESTPIDAELNQALPPHGKGVATAVLRLIGNKNLDLLLEAAAELNRKGRDLHVLIVGDGPERTRLRDKAVDLGVNLYLPGAIYDESILAEVYRRTNVSVIPGPAGLTVLQSFRFGVPVVTHDNDSDQRPEAEAIIEGVTGSRFRQGSVASLAEKIDLWVHLDTEARRSTADACQLVVRKEWSAKAQSERIVRTVQEVARSERSNSPTA